MSTNIYFDYGGYYSHTEEECKWISRGPIYALSFRTSTMEEITYSLLVDRLCRKVAIDETTTKLKLSYIPLVVKPQRQSYIFDDEDVYVFLTTMDKELLRCVLHVELIKDLEIDLRGGQLSREERESSFGVNYGELLSSGRANDVVNADILTIHRADEAAEQHHELMENVVIEEPMENNAIEDGENVPRDEFAAVDSSVMHEYTELPHTVEESQLIGEWEDGTGLEIGQEFSSKEALQDLVARASLLNCFGFTTVKSDTQRLVLQCSQAKEGCKWYVRVAKVKKSDNFSVRVYRKMHTCSRVNASTSSNKRNNTPRLVASILHEEYQGKFDTVAPKNLISIVQERLGVQVSYSTALRGKKRAVNDVCGSPETREPCKKKSKNSVPECQKITALETDS
uniref:Transposase MuDR plant domain-containing protein n=1 Tax=Noccaea caerulescens TaxID=107243 RepID=A0A1J3DJ64_NOCCA